MTRRRENLAQTRSNGSEDPHQDGRTQRKKKNMPALPKQPKGTDFTSAFLSDNWKQQSLVKKSSRNTALTSVVLVLQMLAAVGMTAFAANEGGAYIPAAIGTGIYTVATINNSFDKNLHGLIGFLDSPFMIMSICALLLMQIVGGPASVGGYFGYILCSLPFFWDMLLSMRTVYLTTSQERQSTATVEEIPVNEEHFISMNNDEDRDPTVKEEMYEPSDRLMPDAIAQIEPVNNLLTRNWKENAYAQGNSTAKQLSAFALILGYFYLGGSAVESQAMVPLGSVTLAYAASSLMGYFGLGNAPVAKLMRTNMVSIVCAIMGICSMVSSGMDIHLAMLTVLHLFDAYQGASQAPERTNVDNEFESMNAEAQNQPGPIMSFFTESWKVNSFNRRNYDTCQTVQILMFGAQLYFVLIAMINGDSFGICSAVLAMVMAGAYSFFSPVRVTAIDAIQSNGTQLAVLGGATHQIVTTNPGISFYILFCLLAADSLMSCSTFFQEHQDHMLRSSGSAMGLIEKDGNQGAPSRHDNNQDGEGYNRQM